MKRLFKSTSLYIILSLFLFQNCTIDNNNLLNENEYNSEKTNKKKPVANLVYKCDNENYTFNNNLKHYSSDYNVTNLNIDIAFNPNDNFTYKWVNALDEAILEWNSFSCNGFNLQRISNYSIANIKITFDNPSQFSPNGVASGDAPTSSGLPGPFIYINSSPTVQAIVTDDKAVSTMVHEIGHTLGFEHTNGNTGTYIPGTQDGIDWDSFTISNIAAHNWSSRGFSNDDIIAINYLYPCPITPPSPPTVNIVGPIFGNNTSYYTWTANVTDGTPPFTYTWERISNNGITYPWGSGNISVTEQMPLDQDLFIKVTITDANGLTAEDDWLTENTGDDWH